MLSTLSPFSYAYPFAVSQIVTISEVVIERSHWKVAAGGQEGFLPKEAAFPATDSVFYSKNKF